MQARYYIVKGLRTAWEVGTQTRNEQESSDGQFLIIREVCTIKLSENLIMRHIFFACYTILALWYAIKWNQIICEFPYRTIQLYRHQSRRIARYDLNYNWKSKLTSPERVFRVNECGKLGTDCPRCEPSDLQLAMFVWPLQSSFFISLPFFLADSHSVTSLEHVEQRKNGHHEEQSLTRSLQ